MLATESTCSWGKRRSSLRIDGNDGARNGLLSTSFQKSTKTEELNMPIKECTDKLQAAGKLHDFGALGRWTVEEHDRFVVGK